MSLVVCPLVVSQASQHLRSSETQTTCEGCFARQSICRTFPFTPACQGSTPTGVFEGECRPLTLFTFCSELIEGMCGLTVKRVLQTGGTPNGHRDLDCAASALTVNVLVLWVFWSSAFPMCTASCTNKLLVGALSAVKLIVLYHGYCTTNKRS